MIELIDPQLATDERTTLTQFLDFYRTVLARKIDGLTEEQARTPNVEPSDLTMLGLVRHMADVERNWFRRRYSGLDAAPLFYGDSHPTADPDGDLHPSPEDTVAQALGAWQAEIEFGRSVTANGSLDDLSVQDAGGGRPQFNMRWMLVHLIEEYARHCGHADLIRERIDGAKGD